MSQSLHVADNDHIFSHQIFFARHFQIFNYAEYTFKQYYILCKMYLCMWKSYTVLYTLYCAVLSREEKKHYPCMLPSLNASRLVTVLSWWTWCSYTLSAARIEVTFYKGNVKRSRHGVAQYCMILDNESNNSLHHNIQNSVISKCVAIIWKIITM